MEVIQKPVYKCEHCGREFISSRGARFTSPTIARKGQKRNSLMKG